MNLKYVALGFLLFFSHMSNAADTTPSLNEKLAHLRNGKSVNLDKDELAVFLGKAEIRALLSAKSVQEIKAKRERQERLALLIVGVGIGSIATLCFVAAVAT